MCETSQFAEEDGKPFLILMSSKEQSIISKAKPNMRNTNGKWEKTTLVRL